MRKQRAKAKVDWKKPKGKPVRELNGWNKKCIREEHLTKAVFAL